MEHSEIGRELKLPELVPKTVYVLRKPGAKHAMTMWFVGESGRMAQFWMEQHRTNLILFVRGDGTFHDDKNETVGVYEWLRPN